MASRKKGVGFALQGIKTEQFAILPENFSETKKQSITTGISFSINNEKKIVVVILTVEYYSEDKVFIKLVLSTHFNIEEKSWESFYAADNDKMIIPKGLLAHLSAITVSTARGVLFAKLEATQFSKYLMPLINVASMITEDAVFEKD
jgi:hypothetical protein